jgi:hypothetical protein
MDARGGPLAHHGDHMTALLWDVSGLRRLAKAASLVFGKWSESGIVYALAFSPGRAAAGHRPQRQDLTSGTDALLVPAGANRVAHRRG